MFIQLEYSGGWLELKNTEEKKWRRCIYLTLASTPYPSSPGCFFLLIFLCTYPESRGLRSPPHYPKSHFVLRVRESRDYSRKTTSRKNDLYRVEPPYLLPLLPLSSNIIRIIVRNVPVWESYNTHLSNDRLRAA